MDKQTSLKDQDILELIGLFEILAEHIGDNLKVGIKNEKIAQKIVTILASLKKDSVEEYILIRFISRCKVAEESVIVKEMSKRMKMMGSNQVNQVVDLTEKIKENFVLKNYKLGEADIQKFNEQFRELLDTHNCSSKNNLKL